MSDILLDEDIYDIDLTTSDFQLTLSADAIKQHLKQRLNTFANEFFLDSRVGIPYFEHILVKNPDPIIIDSLLKKEIINTPGVLELPEFSLDLTDTRQLDISFKVLTTSGEINFSEVIPDV